MGGSDAVDSVAIPVGKAVRGIIISLAELAPEIEDGASKFISPGRASPDALAASTPQPMNPARMAGDADAADRLLERIHEHEREIERLKALLASPSIHAEPPEARSSAHAPQRKWPLEQEEYKRYGRQLILPELGISGQLRLRDARVLIVGIGGLGCPAAAYLAGAGIGVLGLMDGDTVDTSNLHRQVLHSTEMLGKAKVESAAAALKRLNPLVKYKLHPYHLDPQTAVADFIQYDLVLDCTDRPASRYLVSDAAVCAGIPLISGAALRTDGQVYVLNFPSFRSQPGPDYVSGPCYRCVHPKPPPADSLVTCAEGGILGPVVGTIGVLMATEAIKVLTSSLYTPIQISTQPDIRQGTSASHASLADAYGAHIPAASMLMYSAYASPPFRSVRLRGRRNNCLACSPDAALRTIDAESLQSGRMDYVAFCGQLSQVQILPAEKRMDPQRLAQSLEAPLRERVLLLDVRNDTEFDICSLPNSMHVPLSEVRKRAAKIAAKAAENDVSSVVAVCRFGNDSQVAAKILQEELSGIEQSPWIGDLKGGLAAWTRGVDPDFPNY